jgi:hypothetical protein
MKKSSKIKTARRITLAVDGLRAAPPAVVVHVLNTLPDSLRQRQELLEALSRCIPSGEETGVWVRALQFHLQEHQRLCSAWPEAPFQGGGSVNDSLPNGHPASGNAAAFAPPGSARA